MTGQKLTRTIIKLTAITNSSNRCNVTLFKIFSLIAIINTSSKQLCNQRLPAWWQSTPQSATHLLCPLTGGALSNAFLWRLSITYIGTKSRTKRPRKTKIGTEVAHVTHDSDTTTFKVKRLKASLLSAALTHEAGAAVTVRTYWSWETTATYVASARRRARRWGAHARGGEGRGHIVSPRAQLVDDTIDQWRLRFTACSCQQKTFWTNFIKLIASRLREVARPSNHSRVSVVSLH